MNPKTTNAVKGKTVGQIVASDYRKATIFKKYGIDYSCNGNVSIDMACKEHGINPANLLAELEDLKANGTTEKDYNHWPLDILVDYIMDNHHQYLRENLPEIEFYAKTVEEIHGDTHMELLKLYVEFLKLSGEIQIHMDQEEEHLFPFIKRLASDKDYQKRDKAIDSSVITDTMQQGHKQTMNTLATIRKLSDDYRPPADASTTYRALYEYLAVLDDDLHKHIHLENNILFPKALELI